MKEETKIIKSFAYIFDKKTKIEYNLILCSIRIYMKIAYVQGKINSNTKKN